MGATDIPVLLRSPWHKGCKRIAIKFLCELLSHFQHSYEVLGITYHFICYLTLIFIIICVCMY